MIPRRRSPLNRLRRLLIVHGTLLCHFFGTIKVIRRLLFGFVSAAHVALPAKQSLFVLHFFDHVFMLLQPRLFLGELDILYFLIQEIGHLWWVHLGIVLRVCYLSDPRVLRLMLLAISGQLCNLLTLEVQIHFRTASHPITLNVELPPIVDHQDRLLVRFACRVFKR